MLRRYTSDHIRKPHYSCWNVIWIAQSDESDKIRRGSDALILRIVVSIEWKTDTIRVAAHSAPRLVRELAGPRHSHKIYKQRAVVFRQIGDGLQKQRAMNRKSCRSPSDSTESLGNWTESRWCIA